MRYPKNINYTVANEFSRLVRQYYEPIEFMLVIDLNNSTYANTSCCATHDFYDANEIMSEAFTNVTGKEVNIQSDAQCSIWGNAWDIAKNSDFQPINMQHA